MKSHSAPVSRFVAPLRSIAQRFAYSSLLLLSIGVIVLNKADPAVIARARMLTADIMAPILGAIGQPVAAVSGAVARFHQAVTLFQENDRLRSENAALLQWQDAARRLEAENDQLRSLTKYQPSNSTWFISARVIGTSGGAFSRSLLVDRGRADGVAKGQAVTSGSGLAGRVAEVGERAARVLLLTDLNSRIPVTVESTHDRAILAGDNSDQPSLVYLPSNSKIQVGDRVVTSGDGGIFSPGISVGVVAQIQGGQARVSLSTDLSQIDYVRIVDFGLAGVLPADAAPKPKSPDAKSQGRGAVGDGP